MSKSVNIASSNAKNEYGEVSDEIRDDTVLLKGLMDKSDESSSHLVRRAFERADEGAEISKKKAKRLFEDLQSTRKSVTFRIGFRARNSRQRSGNPLPRCCVTKSRVQSPSWRVS